MKLLITTLLAIMFSTSVWAGFSNSVHPFLGLLDDREVLSFANELRSECIMFVAKEEGEDVKDKDIINTLADKETAKNSTVKGDYDDVVRECYKRIDHFRRYMIDQKGYAGDLATPVIFSLNSAGNPELMKSYRKQVTERRSRIIKKKSKLRKKLRYSDKKAHDKLDRDYPNNTFVFWMNGDA